VVAETVKLDAAFVYSSVLPEIVIVHGEAAPIQVLLHPLVPQQVLKNCIVNVTSTETQLGAGRHDPKSLKIEIFVPLQFPELGKLQNQ
jgi:hypothetical protein